MNPDLIKRIRCSAGFANCLKTAKFINCCRVEGEQTIQYSDLINYIYYFVAGFEWEKETRTLTIYFDEYDKEGKQKLDAELERIVEAL